MADTDRSPSDEPPTLVSLAEQIAALQRGLEVVIRQSSPPPAPKDSPSEPPRSSMRAAGKVIGKGTKWTAIVSGALSLLGTLIALFRPEYSAPLLQAIKLILQLAYIAAGNTPPAVEQPPPPDVPAIVAPAPEPAALPEAR